MRRCAALLLALSACSSPPPAPPPPAPPPSPGRAPLSPPGTEGLTPAPCSKRIDLARNHAAARAFDPGPRRLSARTTLSFVVRGPPPVLRWTSSRPGAIQFEDAPAGLVRITAGEPGVTLARLEIGDGEEEASVLISVPMFVVVVTDSDFTTMLDRVFGLGRRERAVLEEAKRTVLAVYDRVNLRVAFRSLGEGLPTELPSDAFMMATLHGDLRACVTPRSSLLHTEFGGYGEGDGTRRLDRSPVHVCPAIFARHPDTMAAMVKDRARLLADESAAPLYEAIVGRAVGELLAHEIGHQLLGCDNRGERRFWRCHDRLPHSLMNKAGERSFTDRTGVVIEPTQYASYWRSDFPAAGTFEDRGLAAINRLPDDGQAVLDRILPVPPALAEDVPCPP
jgi:hypothetical protein